VYLKISLVQYGYAANLRGTSDRRIVMDYGVVINAPPVSTAQISRDQFLAENGPVEFKLNLLHDRRRDLSTSQD